MPVPKNPSAALDVAHLTAGWSTRRAAVLDDVSLTIPDAGVHRLAGANGAGKSTLIECGSGYLVPWSGTVTVSGRDAAAPEARALRRTCRTTPALYPVLTVAEHLEVAATARGAALGPVHERAERYRLTPWLDREARELSTGNCRKLWFVLCTLGSFTLALLDEPFNGLDDEARTLMCEEIAQWSSDRAVVVVAHEPPPQLRVASEIAIKGHPIVATHPLRDAATMGSVC